MKQPTTFKERYAKLKKIVTEQRRLSYSLKEYYESKNDTRNRDKEWGEYLAWDNMLSMLDDLEQLEAMHKVLFE